MINIPSDENILGLSSWLAGELVYRLCVAECARIGFKLAEIDKLESTEAHGDLHIRIALPAYSETSCYIPHPQTLICVKARYIPLALVQHQEIHGEYLETFDAERGAAYILASTRQVLDNSRTADYQRKMPRALNQQVGKARAIDLDPHFFSRGTMRTWLSEHPDVQHWLQQKYASTERKVSNPSVNAPKNVIYSKRLQRPT
jgi:hypothetical protein